MVTIPVFSGPTTLVLVFSLTFSMMSFEEGMAAQFSILAWRLPWTEEPGRLQSVGSHRVEHDWTYFHLALVSLYDSSLTLWQSQLLVLRSLKFFRWAMGIFYFCGLWVPFTVHGIPSHLSLFLLCNSCPHFHSAFPLRIWHIVSTWAMHIKLVIKWM